MLCFLWRNRDLLLTWYIVHQPIFTYFRLELNLAIYLTLPYGQAFSLVSSKLCFLHFFNTLLSVWFQLHWVPSLPFFSFSQTLKEIKKISFTKHVQANVARASKRRETIISFIFVFVVIASAYSTKHIYIDRSTMF